MSPVIPTAMSPVIPFELIDPARYPADKAADTWRDLRKEHPIWWCRVNGSDEGFWAVVRHRDVAAMCRDTVRLSSGRGEMLVSTDPPRHTEVRRILRGGFSQQAVLRIVDSVKRAAKSLVGEFVAAGGGDFAQEVAGQVPLVALCKLFDVPSGERSRILGLTATALRTDSYTTSMDDSAAAQRDILHFYANLLRQRRGGQGDDIVSLMAATDTGGATLSSAEVVMNCYNILVGGSETTRFAAAGGMLAFINNPDQWHLLKSDASLLDSAVEEILRWTTPATHVARIATEPIQVHGCQIRKGDIVTLWNSSANRDEDVFEQPDDFNIARTPNRHLALGHGPHFCIGSALARAELRILLEEFLRSSITDVKVVGSVSYISSSFLAGICRLPVRIGQGRSRAGG